MIVTANDLLSGAVVFWTGDAWSPRVDDALVLDEATVQAEALATAEADDLSAVGAYLAAVDEAGPSHFRERIRLTGPTIAYAGRDAGRKA